LLNGAFAAPVCRFKEDGSHNTNQYDFKPSDSATFKGSRPEPPQVVVQDNPPGRPEPPEQSEENKKKLTISDSDCSPTEKQKTCKHPRSEVAVLADNIIICHHCYTLLNEDGTSSEFERVKNEETLPVEIVMA
jgi:hypothetical protein